MIAHRFVSNIYPISQCRVCEKGFPGQPTSQLDSQEILESGSLASSRGGVVVYLLFGS
ncbi:hypothetical protein ASPCADRAFT_208578 [Aspergillus carbonarius ITEM 5010]|uniref:Uncharacterized protein n=1 Tax=Aspergillus carbonarius (strain ITEM 5010) TaxID=602072 RepID=A0A1R3RKB3_ASPC5|nr:hypothetical protein ASPCADRAFT_208578 [Aspergillus carbonarius ITEM 5010]